MSREFLSPFQSQVKQNHTLHRQSYGFLWQTEHRPRAASRIALASTRSFATLNAGKSIEIRFAGNGAINRPGGFGVAWG